jgi:hypothetical protein
VAAVTALLSSIVRIGAGETQVFHWPHPVRDHKPWVCFKREGPGMDGWHWSETRCGLSSSQFVSTVWLVAHSTPLRLCFRCLVGRASWICATPATVQCW